MFTLKVYNRIFLPLLCCFFFSALMAQDLSLLLSPGLMNYGGDIQDKAYTFSQANFSFGAGLAYRIKKISVRASVNFGKVQGDDFHNTQFKERNLSFASNIFDGNIAFEYDLFSMDEKKFTPYVFAGAGIFHFNPYTTYNSQKVFLQPLGTEGQGLNIYPDKKFYSLTQFMIPLGIGMKYKLSDRFLIGVEFNSRFLFTDYLDDVSDKYPDRDELFKARGQVAVDLSFRGNEVNPALTFPSGKTRGNPAQNDNYYTSSITLIYVFPKQSLFGGSGKKTKGIKELNCPKRIH